MPSRQVNYPQGSDIDSFGRNGHVRTTGCLVSAFDGKTAQVEPINSRGDVARCRIGIAAEALGEVGAACVELYFERCSPADREALLRRLARAAGTAPEPEDGTDEETGQFFQGLDKP